MIKNLTILLFCFFCFTFQVNIVYAGCSNSSYTTQSACTGAGGVWANDTTTQTGGTVSLTDPLSGVTPQALIGKIIKGVLGLVGSLALAMFVYGGFTWMLAAGNSTNVEKGKQILIWATIGLIVIFSSYALVQFVFKDVLGVT